MNQSFTDRMLQMVRDLQDFRWQTENGFTNEFEARLNRLHAWLTLRQFRNSAESRM